MFWFWLQNIVGFLGHPVFMRVLCVCLCACMYVCIFMCLLACVYAFVNVLVCVSVVEFITDESRTCVGAANVQAHCLCWRWAQYGGSTMGGGCYPHHLHHQHDQHEGGGNMGDVGSGAACHRGWEWRSSPQLPPASMLHLTLLPSDWLNLGCKSFIFATTTMTIMTTTPPACSLFLCVWGGGLLGAILII